MPTTVVINVKNFNIKIIHNMLINDEAHFHLSRYIIKQNSWYWPTTNTHETYQKLLHSAKHTVRCAMPLFQVIAPYSFNDDNRIYAVTVTSKRYDRMMNEFYLFKRQRNLNSVQTRGFARIGQLATELGDQWMLSRVCFRTTLSWDMVTVRDPPNLRTRYFSCTGVLKRVSCSVIHGHKTLKRSKNRSQ